MPLLGKFKLGLFKPLFLKNIKSIEEEKKSHKICILLAICVVPD